MNNILRLTPTDDENKYVAFQGNPKLKQVAGSSKKVTPISIVSFVGKDDILTTPHRYSGIKSIGILPINGTPLPFDVKYEGEPLVKKEPVHKHLNHAVNNFLYKLERVIRCEA